VKIRVIRMLKSIMIKHILTITLSLLFFLVSSPVQARLMLGAVTGNGETPGVASAEQVASLAYLVAEKLGEEVVVKELNDSASLLNWLDRFATLDLALISGQDVKNNRGRFLMIGQLDQAGTLNLVARQGIAGDLPARVAEIVSETGFVPWRSTAQLQGAEKSVLTEAPEVAELSPTAVNEVIAAQVELQHVPPLSPGQAWTPQESGSLSDILPADSPSFGKLVLGVVPDPTGALRTTQQAEQLAAYLEASMPVSVTVREFTQMNTFVEWFMRYKMVDVAVISPELARISLGRDYLPLVKLFRSDKPGEDSAGEIIFRRGQSEEMQTLLQKVLLALPDSSTGQGLMAALKISEIVAPENVERPASVMLQEPAVVSPASEVKVPQIEAPQLEMPGEQLEAEPEIEYPEPTPTQPPVEVVIQPLPELKKSVEPTGAPLQPGMPVVASIPPEPVSAPAPLLVEPAEERVAQLLLQEQQPTPEYPEPIKPDTPLSVQLNDLPELKVASKPVTAPAEIELPVAVATLPSPEMTPAEPGQPIVVELDDVPDERPLPEQPAQPERPLLPTFTTLQKSVSSGPVTETPVPPEQPELPSIEQAPQPPVVESGATLVLPEVPAVAKERPALEVITVPEPIAADVIPGAPKTITEPDSVSVEVSSVSIPEAHPVDSPAGENKVLANHENLSEEERTIVEEVMQFAEPVTHEAAGVPVIIVEQETEQIPEDDLVAFLGEDPVAAMVAQPDIPQELRPSGIPIVRPGRVRPRTIEVQDEVLVASMPEPRRQVEPPRPPKLLPEQEPEPGIVYVVPFVSVMVPEEVSSRVFDQFVDALNQGGEALGLQFLILKEGLQRVSPEWLGVRKYVTGEIYAYVEDSGCCSTDLRSKARLTYRRPDQHGPAFGFEYPVRNFFDHDQSSLEIERNKMSDDIAATLASELLKAIQN
jgi:hypothetical protein